jgi:hypothetical protein
MSDGDGEAGPGDGTLVAVEEEDDYGEGSSSACDRLRDMIVPDDTRRFARHARKLYPRLWPEVCRSHAPISNPAVPAPPPPTLHPSHHLPTPLVCNVVHR